MANRQDLVFELFYGGVWNTVPLFPNSGPVEISRGEANEGSLLTPSATTIVINNRSAIYNPTYPLSPLYGPAGLNTPGRLTMPGTDRRLWGEVASWDPDQTPDFNPVTGRGNAWTTIELTGPLRRVTQNEDALPSTLRGFVDAQPGQVAYFPGEDGSDATAPSNAIPGGYPATATDVSFGADETLPASAGAMRFNSADSSFSAPVKEVPVTGFITGVLLFKLNALPSVFELFRLEATGAAATISIAIDSVAFGINIYGPGGATLVSTGPAHQVDVTEWVALHIGLWQSAPGTISWAFYRHEAGNTLIFPATGSFAGTLGRATRMVMDPAAGRAQGRVAHWVVTNDAFPFVTNGMRRAVAAWAGYETAPQRMARVCAAAGVAFGSVGASPELMGAQRAGQTFTDVMTECQRTDDGMPREQRGTALTIRYRTRADITAAANGAATLTLDYAANDCGLPTRPKLDDQKIVNDVTVSRPGGGSARAELEVGPLSVLASPNGIGRYAKKFDVNPATDVPLPGMASWLMRKGTTGERRFITVTVKKASLLAAAALVDIGDRILINNMSLWISPDPVSLIVIGIKERIETHQRIFSFNCIPARGYEVGIWNTARWDTSNTLRPGVTPIDAIQTSITLDTPVGLLWTMNPAHFPLDVGVGGERMRVTAIAPDTGTRQIFTVARSINGVVKGHPAGVRVRMWPTQSGRYGR